MEKAQDMLGFLQNGGYIKILEQNLDVFCDEIRDICRRRVIYFPETVNISPLDNIYMIEYLPLSREIKIVPEKLFEKNRLSLTIDYENWENWGKYEDTPFIETNKEENKMLKILEIYKDKKEKEITQKYDKQLEELEANDPVTVYVEQAEATLKEMLKTENLKLIVNANVVEYTQETLTKRKEICDIMKNEKKSLASQIKEIEALLELAPNYAEKMQILRDYGIIDKKKNVIL